MVVDYLPFFSNASEVQGDAEVLAAWYVKEMEREHEAAGTAHYEELLVENELWSADCIKNSHGNAGNGKQKHAKSDELGCK